MKKRTTLLVILDGWGEDSDSKTNAIAKANTPVWDKLMANYPHTTLSGSGNAVGLPDDQMGNSEVGHSTIGAGRVLMSDLVRISTAIQTGEFNENPQLNKALQLSASQTLHIIGLLSPGGVHSLTAHIEALIKLAQAKGVQNIVLHAFLDGRDTPPKSAKEALKAIAKQCKIGTICGRYYAMDRDQRWERTKAAYELLTDSKAPFYFSSALEALNAAYLRGETDEFVQPTVITPGHSIQDNDVVVFMNFRSDRARQLSEAFTNPTFSKFKREKCPELYQFLTLTEYTDALKDNAIFKTESLENTLGEYLSRKNAKQLRIAETEKYPHVTFFLNGGREAPFQGEDRILIPSPPVATYDLHPQMSAAEITDALLSAIEKNQYDLIICNYANADMVGHTGNLPATIKAIETLDACLSQLYDCLQKTGCEMVITADHGNAEQLFDETTGQPHTAHTLAPVPFIYVGRKGTITHSAGTLSDIAPTLLYLMGYPKPPEMTGASLIKLDESLLNS